MKSDNTKVCIFYSWTKSGVFLISFRTHTFLNLINTINFSLYICFNWSPDFCWIVRVTIPPLLVCYSYFSFSWLLMFIFSAMTTDNNLILSKKFVQIDRHVLNRWIYYHQNLAHLVDIWQWYFSIFRVIPNHSIRGCYNSIHVLLSLILRS